MDGASVKKKQRERLALLGLKGPPKKCSAHGRIRYPAVRASSSAALREGWLVLPDTATSLIGALIGKLLC